MTQAEAFLAQAKSDLAVYEHLRATNFDLCHQDHYLQMATEKLAKAKMAEGFGVEIKRVHSGFCRYLRLLASRNDPALIQAWNCATFPQFQAKIRGLLPLASIIENAAPALSVDSNPEYPWELPGGSWTAPCRQPSLITPMDAPKLRNLLDLLDILIV